MRCSSWETSITPPCAMEDKDSVCIIHVYSAVHEDARSFIFSLIGLRISQCMGNNVWQCKGMCVVVRTFSEAQAEAIVVT